MPKFLFEADVAFIAAADGKWVPCEGIKFDFSPDGAVNITLASNLHNARVQDEFWAVNDGVRKDYPTEAYL